MTDLITLARHKLASSEPNEVHDIIQALLNVVRAGLDDKSCGCHYEDHTKPDTSPIVTCGWCEGLAEFEKAVRGE